MKRLFLVGVTMVALGAALLPAAATASPTLTMDEARSAIVGHGVFAMGPHFWDGEILGCKRLKTNRIRCRVRGTVEKNSALRTCKSRVEVVENAEIRVRVLKRKCRMLNVRVLTNESARRAAAKAMDPMAFHPMASIGHSSSTYGRNRYTFDAKWINENQQICIQSAKVKMVDEKVKVNVSEVACVDQPEWPTAG